MARKTIKATDVLEPKEELVGGEVGTDNFDNLRNQVNSKLDEAKGKFTAVAIVGVTEDGTFDLVTNVSQYSYLQWLLGKGSFELFIHEKNANMPKAA